jgi:YidC/Oxa1 family membrane protein insertase
MDSIIFSAEMTNIFGQAIRLLYTLIQNYALTVVVFTVLFKIITSPLDFWQKRLTRKNAKAMKAMKPKLEQMKKEVGDNQQLYMQRQQAIYKEHGYSMLGTCLPMIVTLAVFITIFSGFTAMVKYQNETVFEALQETYYGVYDPAKKQAQIDFFKNQYSSEEEKEKVNNWTEAEFNEKSNDLSTKEKNELLTKIDEEANIPAQEAVIEEYENNRRDKLLWIGNIFMSDTPWSDVIPDYGLFSGTSGGFLGMGRISANVGGLTEEEYNKVMAPLIDKYDGKPNGYLILPLICFLLNILMMKLNPQQNQQAAAPPAMGMNSEVAAKQAQMSSKVMMYFMPAMIFVFAMFYSSAFTLYLIISTTFSLAFNLIYNKVTKKRDKKEEEIQANTVHMRKSELEALRKQKEKEEKEKKEKEMEEKAKKLLEKTEPNFKDIDK